MTTETTTASAQTGGDTGQGLLFFVLGAVLLGVLALVLMTG